MILASSLAFFLVIFLLASILTAIAYLAFLKMKADESDAERSDLTLSKPPDSRAAPSPKAAKNWGSGIESSPLLQSGRLSSITFWDTMLAHFDFVAHVTEPPGSGGPALVRRPHHQHDAAGGRDRAGRADASAAAVGGFAGSRGGIHVAPYGYVLHLRNKRFMKFRENFPDALDSLARALRAGYPLSAGMEMIATETAPPVSGEIRRTSAEANLGRGWPHALENLGQRIPLLEVNLFIAAVQLHARTGGKLSEVMTRPRREYARIERAARRSAGARGIRQTHWPDPDHPAQSASHHDADCQPGLHAGAVQ